MKGKLEDDVDVLFTLPLSEFIAARKELAARLKKNGRADESEYVKSLAKPSISAWTANQLYWEHREAFDRLIATGQRFRKAQTSGKLAEMRDALDARRDALSHLSDLASALLRDADHNPTLDMMRRITTTLEAMSAYAELPDGARPGRLTKDIDPPGFESLASFVPSAVTTERAREPARVAPSKSVSSAPKTQPKTKASAGATRSEETRRVRIAAAKVSLQNAKKALTEARARAQALEGTQKKADAEAKEAEKHRREAEQLFKKASAAAEAATRSAQSVRDEVAEATKALEDARRAVEKLTKELESLFRESLS